MSEERHDGSEDWVDHELYIERCPYCGNEMYDSDGDWVCPNLCESMGDI